MEKVHGGARKSSHSKGAGGAGGEAGVSPPRLCRATGWTSGRCNVLATQTRQPPTRDSARASYENQNQNIKILLYYTTTMSSTTPQLLSLDQED